MNSEREYAKFPTNGDTMNEKGDLPTITKHQDLAIEIIKECVKEMKGSSVHIPICKVKEVIDEFLLIEEDNAIKPKQIELIIEFITLAFVKYVTDEELSRLFIPSNNMFLLENCNEKELKELKESSLNNIYNIVMKLTRQGVLYIPLLCIILSEYMFYYFRSYNSNSFEDNKDIEEDTKGQTFIQLLQNTEQGTVIQTLMMILATGKRSIMSKDRKEESCKKYIKLIELSMMLLQVIVIIPHYFIYLINEVFPVSINNSDVETNRKKEISAIFGMISLNKSEKNNNFSNNCFIHLLKQYYRNEKLNNTNDIQKFRIVSLWKQLELILLGEIKSNSWSLIDMESLCVEFIRNVQNDYNILGKYINILSNMYNLIITQGIYKTSKENVNKQRELLKYNLYNIYTSMRILHSISSHDISLCGTIDGRRNIVVSLLFLKVSLESNNGDDDNDEPEDTNKVSLFASKYIESNKKKSVITSEHDEVLTYTTKLLKILFFYEPEPEKTLWGLANVLSRMQINSDETGKILKLYLCLEQTDNECDVAEDDLSSITFSVTEQALPQVLEEAIDKLSDKLDIDGLITRIYGIISRNANTHSCSKMAGLLLLQSLAKKLENTQTGTTQDNNLKIDEDSAILMALVCLIKDEDRDIQHENTNDDNDLMYASVLTLKGLIKSSRNLKPSTFFTLTKMVSSALGDPTLSGKVKDVLCEISKELLGIDKVNEENTQNNKNKKLVVEIQEETPNKVVVVDDTEEYCIHKIEELTFLPKILTKNLISIMKNKKDTKQQVNSDLSDSLYKWMIDSENHIYQLIRFIQVLCCDKNIVKHSGMFTIHAILRYLQHISSDTSLDGLIRDSSQESGFKMDYNSFTSVTIVPSLLPSVSKMLSISPELVSVVLDSLKENRQSDGYVALCCDCLMLFLKYIGEAASVYAKSIISLLLSLLHKSDSDNGDNDLSNVSIIIAISDIVALNGMFISPGNMQSIFAGVSSILSDVVKRINNKKLTDKESLETELQVFDENINILIRAICSLIYVTVPSIDIPLSMKEDVQTLLSQLTGLRFDNLTKSYIKNTQEILVGALMIHSGIKSTEERKHEIIIPGLSRSYNNIK